VRSYWFQEGLRYLKNNDYIAVGSNHGHFGFEIRRFVTGPEGWLSFRDEATAGSWVSSTVLGFGFEYRKNQNYPGSTTIVTLPWWAATLLVGVAPFWLYRRQRKRHKPGFPMERVAASSTK